MAFTAKYDGLCGECLEPIRRGDQLEWAEGEAVHVECGSESGRLPNGERRPVCPRCFQVVAVNGACGCDPE